MFDPDAKRYDYLEATDGKDDASHSSPLRRPLRVR